MIRLLGSCFVLMLFLSIENIAIAQIVSDPIYPNLTDLQIKLKALANDYSDIV